MKNKKLNDIFLILLSAVCVSSVIILAYIFETAVTAVDEMCILFALIPVVLALRLAKWTKREFYSYANAAYIAGIFFTVPLAVDVIVFRISSSTITYNDVFELIKDFPFKFSNIAVPVVRHLYRARHKQYCSYTA